MPLPAVRAVGVTALWLQHLSGIGERCRCDGWNGRSSWAHAALPTLAHAACPALLPSLACTMLQPTTAALWARCWSMTSPSRRRLRTSSGG